MGLWDLVIYGVAAGENCCCWLVILLLRLIKTAVTNSDSCLLNVK